MRSLRVALPQTIKALGISRRTRAAQALLAWSQVVGPEVAHETVPLKLEGATLWVSATSTPLAHQLHLERVQLLERINLMIGAPVVRDIRFIQRGAR